jgi:putative component of membrane protein insertase Oxa1/YidC/SpoIIIJ protein YidD
MIKKIALLLISVYQAVFSHILKNISGVSNACRFEVSCSEYAKQEIEKGGAIQGGVKSIKRLLLCQPFYNGNI